MRDTGLTALVTGGARRIGAAIVNDLSTAGFSIVIHCNRSTGEAEVLAEKLRSRGGVAHVARADLEEADAADRLVGQAADALGAPIRLLVNNASVFEADTADAIDWAAWRRHFAVHVEAPARLTAAMAHALPAPDTGLVVNLVDQRVRKPTPQFFSYSLSKHALDAATRMMAQTYAPRLRVNAIGPGPTLANERQSAADFRAQEEALLLGKGPALREFAATILYMWNTPSITGQTIMLDGGQHLAWQTPDVVGMRE